MAHIRHENRLESNYLHSGNKKYATRCRHHAHNAASYPAKVETTQKS